MGAKNTASPTAEPDSKTALAAIKAAAVELCAEADTEDAVTQLRSRFLGKKGEISQQLRGLSKLKGEERPAAGERINVVKRVVEAALAKAQERVRQAKVRAALHAGWVDVSLPGRRVPSGGQHPLRIIEAEIVSSLRTLGFTVADGPLIEHDWYNFESLNLPPDHPARDMQDTFFISENVVLRTHTSNVQTRTMVKLEPPVRILSPGMVFRKDDVDPTHSPVFHQIEGLWIDDKVTFADLKGVLRKFAADIFGPDAQLRFRPSFFPFTEPSTEIDVTCVVCEGSGRRVHTQEEHLNCRVCRGTGWIEILGAGMVDPAVLEMVGYDPEHVQGFAFGAGIERIAMLRWGIDDIRLFYENDLRFVQHYNTPII